MKFVFVFICIILFAQQSTGIVISSPPELRGTFIDWSLASFTGSLPPPPGITGNLSIPTDQFACTSLSENVTGKYVLLTRGGCAFTVKSDLVYAAGGLGLLIQNTAAGDFVPGALVIAKIPVLGLTMAAGQLLRNLTKQNGGPLTLTFSQATAVPAEKDALTNFYLSTNGPNWRQQGTSAYKPFFWENYATTDPCQQPWQGITCNPDGTVRVFNIDTCNVSGAISDISALTSIEKLLWASNYMYGTVPSYFSGFTKLKRLSMGSNGFSGTLPEVWGSMKLESLSLESNSFEGSIPASLFQNTNLTTLTLQSNRFSGSIASTISQLTSLSTFTLTSNRFSGPFPPVYYAPALTAVSMANNQFSGTIPADIGNMNLTTLDIGGNQLSGTFPPALTLMDSMRYLDISNNQFSGVAPVPGAKTRFFIANRNKFTSLSTGLTACTYLALVDFSYNNLTGAYTDFTGRLPVPTTAQVQENQCLQYIDFSNNFIRGANSASFQLTLTSWPLLVQFSMRNNSISNTVQLLVGSSKYLRTIDVSQNNLTGTIPLSLANLPNLVTANFSYTSMKYSGDFLASSFQADLSTLTYVASASMSCPKITAVLSGGEVIVDNTYHNYELCVCEPNYRRNNSANTVLPDVDFNCVACPTGLICPGRQNDTNFVFMQNYYPTPSEADPQELITCRNCQPEQGPVFTCAPHHSGRMCSFCDSSYYWTGVKCDKCVPVGSSLIVISIFLLAALLIAYALYSLFLRGLLCIPQFTREAIADKEMDTGETPKVFSDKRMEAYETKNSQSVIDPNVAALASISIAINYYQTVSALSQYFSLPTTVIKLMQASRILSSATGGGLSLSCLSDQLNDYNNLFTVVMSEPAVVVGVVAIFYLVGRIAIFIAEKILRRPKPMVLTHWNITSLTMLLFGLNFLFFPISSTAINSFRCSRDPVTNINYNSAYPYARCDSIAVGNRVAALILFSGGLLVIFSSLIVYFNRLQPGDKGYYLIGNSFGFMFLHYRKKYNMFAIIVLLRRFILSLLISLIRVDSVLSFGLISAVLVISITANHLVQPFRSLRDNHLETLTLLAALFAYTLAFTLSIDTLDYGSIPIVIFYFFINISIIIWCGIEFLSGQLPQVKALLEYIRGQNTTRVASDRPPEVSPRKMVPLETTESNNDTTRPLKNNSKENDSDIEMDGKSTSGASRGSVTISLSNVSINGSNQNSQNNDTAVEDVDEFDLNRSDAPIMGKKENDNN